MNDPLNDRRSFLQLAGAGAVLATAEACALGPTDEHIVPFVHDTPEVNPGKPSYYATALTYNGYARPVIATTQAGRPVKIDGNSEHPATLGGGSTVFEQVSLLDLYNDGRLKQVTHGRDVASYTALADFLGKHSGALTLVLDQTTSPTIARLVHELIAARPQTKVFYNGRYSARVPIYDLADIERLATFGNDPTDKDPLAIRYARQLGEARRAPDRPVRIYSVATAPRGLGLLADHRAAVRPTVAHRMLARLAQAMELSTIDEPLSADNATFVRIMSADLKEASGHSLVLGDRNASPHVQTLVQAINAVLSPQRVRWIDTPLVGDAAAFDQRALLSSLADSLVVMIGGNPAREVLGFAEALRHAKASIYCGMYPNTTSAAAEWVAPLSHAFESWLDLRSGDGVLSLGQPLVKPLFKTRGLLELLGMLTAPQVELSSSYAREAVRTTFTQANPTASFDTALRMGFLAPDNKVREAEDASAEVNSAIEALLADAPSDDAIELDLPGHDSALIHNGWALELPQPVTSLTWENAALMSPVTAGGLDVKTGDVIRLNDVLDIPALITAGHADGAITVERGWGEVSVTTGTVLGADASRLGNARSVKVLKTGRSTALAVTQPFKDHREEVTRVTAVAPSLLVEPRHADLPSLHDAKPGEAGKGLGGRLWKQQWGMAIDMNACTGCGACAIACQAENNIPVVGKTSVLRNRHMHWLRIDTVLASGAIVQQPMLCQH
ncbi:MAG: hypothetical protein H7Z43_06685, partial [Clostridia bacterium]|nr:hypothetical protein [Deltaproteobacteria bacterium]